MVITGVRTKPPVRVFTLQLCNDVIDGGMMILKKFSPGRGTPINIQQTIVIIVAVTALV